MRNTPAAVPRPFVRRLLGIATLGAVGLITGVLVATGRVEWKLVTLAGVLWAAYSFIGGLYSQVIEPAGRFLANQLTGNVSMPVKHETIEELTVRLERLLEHGTTPHHELLTGIRLAEIYRTHQKDAARSAALLARLRAKYPDAPELAHAGSD